MPIKIIEHHALFVYPLNVPITLERTPHQKQVFAKALLESGSSVRAVRKLTGLSSDVITEINHRSDYNLETIGAIQKRLPAKCYITADWAFNNLTPAKMEACSAPQLMMVAGIAIDKARDMEGSNRPVINIVELSLSVTKALAESRQRLHAIDAAIASTQAT